MAKKDLAGLPLDALKAELDRRQKTIDKLREKQAGLIAKRDELNVQIIDLDQQIRVLGGEVGLAEISSMLTGINTDIDVDLAATTEVEGENPKVTETKAAPKKPAAKKTTKKTTAKKAASAAKSSGALADVIAGVLPTTGGMKIPDIIENVLATGYETTSKNFRTIVNQTLRDTRFEKVGRGLYRVKK